MMRLRTNRDNFVTLSFHDDSRQLTTYTLMVTVNGDLSREHKQIIKGDIDKCFDSGKSHHQSANVNLRARALYNVKFEIRAM